jgi:hypothetical protein
MGIADFGAGAARVFAVRFLGALDQTTVGGKLLYPREAVDVVDFVEQHETENLADAWYGLQQIQGVGVMMFGGFNESIPAASPVGPEQYAIPLPAQTAAKAALYLAIRQVNITKVELAERLHCDEKEVRRLLDPRHASKLSRLESALAALGQHLVIGVKAAV